MNTMMPDDGPQYGPWLMSAHQLQVARELVQATDAGDRLHEEACSMPPCPERVDALMRATSALSRAANLAREYADLMGDCPLSGREPGENRADYSSARRAHESRRKINALAHARAVIAKAEDREISTRSGDSR